VGLGKIVEQGQQRHRVHAPGDGHENLLAVAKKFFRANLAFDMAWQIRIQGWEFNL
jgi:hypothetical protein